MPARAEEREEAEVYSTSFTVRLEVFRFGGIEEVEQARDGKCQV
jgi:hypothetical protein